MLIPPEATSTSFPVSPSAGPSLHKWGVRSQTILMQRPHVGQGSPVESMKLTHYKSNQVWHTTKTL